MNKAQKQVAQAQLNREKQTIKELKQVYQWALRDCEQKIRELSERTDMENLQSIIYQKQYQEALKAQLEGVLSNLQSNSYATVSDYLTKCYRDGYTGVMYDLQKTGIPIIMPIDQAAVVRAIQTDSKLSKSLYDKMGEDVTYLKKAVRAEVSRGIANGSTWNEVAGKLSRHMANTPFQKAYNNSIRIARTEGHRIQVQSALDAMYIAKSKGADVLKQWDATLDGATREHHQMLDGQIREVDEPFEVGGRKIKAPGMFGDPAEDCNCRCCLLQRARWALDDEELETLRERAEYFGLDKTKDFEEYQTKYFKVSCEIEHEKEQSKPKYIYKDTVIHKKIIESPDYRRKFNQISDSDRVNRIAWQRSKEMLTHRSGTRYEDIAFVDYLTGKSKINKGYHEESTAKPNKAMIEMLYNSKPNTIIAIHNHPGSSVPSLADLMTCKKRAYKFGLVVCHDGKIYKYSVDKEKFNAPIASSALAQLEIKGYNDNVRSIFEDAGVKMEVL